MDVDETAEAADTSVERFFKKAAPGASLTMADLLSRAAGPGPRAGELVSLVELAGLLLQAPGGEVLTPGQAERELLYALLGDGEWAGRAPSRLAVYCPWGTGHLELDDDVKSSGWCSGESLRMSELRWLWSRHIEGARLADIEASIGLGVRSLAVVRDQALCAFGMQRQASTVDAQPSARRPVGTLVPGLPAPSDLAKELGEMKAQKVKAPVRCLAEKYGCSRDTIGRRLNEARSAASMGVGQFSKFARCR